MVHRMICECVRWDSQMTTNCWECQEWTREGSESATQKWNGGKYLCNNPVLSCMDLILQGACEHIHIHTNRCMGGITSVSGVMQEGWDKRNKKKREIRRKGGHWRHCWGRLFYPGGCLGRVCSWVSGLKQTEGVTAVTHSEEQAENGGLELEQSEWWR